nr:uncharacterized protein LOC123773768 [Procambarus clarkii]
MCSEARPNHSRPKIELVRVSSSERAKIPVNPVQLNLTYCHVRSATYTRPANKSLTPPEAAAPRYPLHTAHRRPRWSWAPWRTNSQTGPPVSTKSCDDLHRVSPPVETTTSRSEGCLLTLLLTPSLLLTPRTSTLPHSGSKYRLWRGFSRSARDVSVGPLSGPPRPAVSVAVMEKLTPRAARPVRHKASTLPYSPASGPQPMGRRHRGLMALLRRLSPRLKRTPSPDRPWVKVEPRPADRLSVASDHSFETALQMRYPDLVTYGGGPVQNNNTHSSSDAGLNKSEGGRCSRGVLTGLLSSLRPSRPGRQDKSSYNSVASDKHRERDTVTITRESDHQLQERYYRDSGGDGEGQHNGGTRPSHLPLSSQVDSRPKADMTTTLAPLHTSTRPTASAQRPHTLNLPNRGHCRAGWTAATGPPPHPPLLPSLPQQMSQLLHTQTTSVDSIGTCSLDVNATGTTSPATMEAVDGSRRSLRSVSLENNFSEITSTGGTIVTTPLRPILKPQPFTDPGSLRDSGGTADVTYKTPSYLGISCAVNGYSRLNRYDSSLRDGFRSRDASPARLAFSRSRDSSPMRPEWKVFDLHTKASPQATAAKIKELKEELARFKAEFPQPPGERGRQNSLRKLGRRPSQGRSISVDRGYLVKSGPREKMNGHENDKATNGGKHVHLVEISMTDSSTLKSSSYQYSFEQSVVRGGISETSDSIHYTAHTNGDIPESKSFIQSRIERLYGPSALGAGFRSRRSLLELEKEQKDRESGGYRSPLLASHIDNHFEPDQKAPEGFPSVFRHLRPEFRTQLQVKRSGRLKTVIPLELPSLSAANNVDSPKRPGRVIPIILTDALDKTIQKPPVPQPKPEIIITSETNRGNKVVNRDNKPVVVQKIVNGNIKESKVALDTESYVNGSTIENTNSVTEEQELAKRTNIVNGVSDSIQVNGIFNDTLEGKDGHYYLKVVEKVVNNIEATVAEIESELKLREPEMSEEVRGKVFAAIGKARLLVSQKIQQFQGLCHKNIAGTIGEEFPTTCEDLAGFWDMVSIQVEDIKNSLQEIMVLRANGWKEITQDITDGVDKNVTTGHARRKPAPRPSRPAKSTRASAEKTEEGKTRDEARKKMLEERRKAMKEALRAKKAETEARREGLNSEAPVEIFIPECK